MARPHPSPRRLAAIASRCEAILGSFPSSRAGPVRWDEARWAFVVDWHEPPGGAGDSSPRETWPVREKFLGPPAMAATSCRRERAKALAPGRRAEAREVLGMILDVAGAVLPLVGGLLGGAAPPR